MLGQMIEAGISFWSEMVDRFIRQVGRVSVAVRTMMLRLLAQIWQQPLIKGLPLVLFPLESVRRIGRFARRIFIAPSLPIII